VLPVAVEAGAVEAGAVEAEAVTDEELPLPDDPEDPDGELPTTVELPFDTMVENPLGTAAEVAVLVRVSVTGYTLVE